MDFKNCNQPLGLDATKGIEVNNNEKSDNSPSQNTLTGYEGFPP